jgi:hypothetical protein
MKTPKVETEEQRKIREAQEVVKQAKEKEQQAWREKWQAQQADPEYQRKQAERNAKSEERSRKIAIGKENAFFTKLDKVREQTFSHEEKMEDVAYHEAGHAVIAEVISNGVSKATILPEANEVKDANNVTTLEVKSLGHVMPNGNLPVSPRQQALIKVAYLRAGGLAMEYSYDGDEEEWGTGNDDKQIEEVIKAYGYEPGTKEHILFIEQASDLCRKMFEDPKVWQAVEDVKDMLLMEYTISGEDIRAVVKKQHYPNLVDIDVTRQRCFRFRKDRVASRCNGEAGASYVLGINLHANTYGYYSGYRLAEPAYVNKFREENAKPIPFPVSYRTQLSLFNAPAPVKKSRKKKVAV